MCFTWGKNVNIRKISHKKARLIWSCIIVYSDTASTRSAKGSINTTVCEGMQCENIKITKGDLERREHLHAFAFTSVPKELHRVPADQSTVH